MQKLLIQFKAVAFIFLFATSIASAHNPPLDRIPLYEHMLEINAEWTHHRSAIPNDIVVQFDSDIDRISTHLRLVVKELRNNTPNGLSSTALDNRMRLLDSLEYYANRKVFPTNTYHSQRTPYFIDNFGVHCAVGYLIAKSGNQELADRISLEYNYDYIRDIKTPGVAEWAEEYGFDLEELKWIQPGYVHERPRTVRLAELKGGKCVGSHSDLANDKLYTFGSFDTLNGEKIGLSLIVETNGSVTPLRPGFEGIVNDVYTSDNILVVSGMLTKEDIDYPLAIRKNNKWTLFNLADGKGLEGKKIISSTTSDIYVEVIDSTNTTQLIRIANDYERITPVTSYQGYATDVSYADTTAYLIGWFGDDARDSLAPFNIKHIGFGEPDGGISNLVNRKLFVGLRWDAEWVQNKRDMPLVLQYDVTTDSMQVFLTISDFVHDDIYNPFYGLETVEINAISIYRNRYMMIGGDFIYQDGWGVFYSCADLLLFDLTLEPNLDNMTSLAPSAYGNNVVSMDYLSDSLLYLTYGNALVKYDHSVSAKKPVIKHLNIYPVPFTKSLRVKGEFVFVRFELLDLQGRIIKKGVVLNNRIDGLSDLTQGIYTLTLHSTDGNVVTQKVIKK